MGYYRSSDFGIAKFAKGFCYTVCICTLDGNYKSEKMRKSFKDSLKALEADIQHANTLASRNPREGDGASFQMRLTYSPVAHFFLCLVQWTNCHLAGALGLLRILIYKTYPDGKTTMSIYERKASIRQFYALIFPSLLQLQRGITELDDRKQKEICRVRYRRKDNDYDKGILTETKSEGGDECGICMEMRDIVVLPHCSHSMCLNCYRDWRKRSQSCPFCRDSLRRMNSGDLWIYTDNGDILALSSIMRENLNRLHVYIEKLPLIVPDSSFLPFVPDPLYIPYDSYRK